MKSALKAAVALAALVGLVFGLTTLTFNTQSPDPGSGSNGGVEEQKPLQFFSATRTWDTRPRRDDESDAASPNLFFPGCFEPGTSSKASFWFENRNTAPVVLRLESVTCASCSSGALASIPPAKTRDYIASSFRSATPAIFGDPAAAAVIQAVTSSVAGVDLVSGLEWKGHDFKTTDWSFTIPPSPSPTESQWAILELSFGTTGKTELGAKFQSQVLGSTKFWHDDLKIQFEVTDAIRTFPAAIDFGEITDSSGVISRDFIVYSSTRAPGELNPKDLAFDVQSPGSTRDAAASITVGPAIPLADRDRTSLAFGLAQGTKRPVKVLSAFRVPVKLDPRAGTTRLDIGALEADIYVAMGSTDPKRVQVRGTVRGEVRLGEGRELDLGSFQAETGTHKTFELVSNRPGLDIGVAKTDVPGLDGKPRSRDYVVVGGQVADEVIQATVKKSDRQETDRGYYSLTLTVPPGAQRGSFSQSYIVLEIRGTTPRRFRIPIKGTAGG